MSQNVMMDFINNIAVMLVLSVIFEAAYLLPRKLLRLRSAFSGVMISAICLVVMSMPYTLEPGVIYDARSILISVTGLIFGLVPTLMTVVVAAIYRLTIGGIGTLPGLSVIISSALIGLAWRRWIFAKLPMPRWLKILIMSIAVHAVMLLCMLLLPYPDSLKVIRAIALPVMLIYPIASVLLGMLLLRQQQFKNIQYQLAQSEERFRILFDKAPLGYQSLDVNGHLIEVNQKWLDTLGYTRDEVIGQWFGNFLAPDYKEAFRTRFPLFKAQGYIHSEFEMLQKGGKAVFIAFDGKIGYGDNGEFKQTHCILQDITQQKANEEELRISEAKYSNYIENAPYGVLVADPNGHYIEANPAASAITGYTNEQLLTMSISSIAAEAFRQDALDHFELLKRNGHLHVEHQFVHQNGSLR